MWLLWYSLNIAAHDSPLFGKGIPRAPERPASTPRSCMRLHEGLPHGCRRGTSFEACLPSTTAGAHYSTRDTMALSVILPLFNHAQFVGKAISELLSQDPPPDEIIVADDAS